MESYESLSQQLQAIINQMQHVQQKIKGSPQPASMHELDQLTRLGQEYAQVTAQMAALETSSLPLKT